LSPAAIEATLATMVSYSKADAAVIDWNAAIILGPDEEDALAVLEFANVELLEMRFLDDRLDAALDVTYSSILKKGEDGLGRTSPLGLLTDPHRDRRRRLAALQMENVVLFEGREQRDQVGGRSAPRAPVRGGSKAIPPRGLGREHPAKTAHDRRAVSETC
jgi:hypothetical protein